MDIKKHYFLLHPIAPKVVEVDDMFGSALFMKMMLVLLISVERKWGAKTSFLNKSFHLLLFSKMIFQNCIEIILLKGLKQTECYWFHVTGCTTFSIF